jgi:hypothetical protein
VSISLILLLCLRIRGIELVCMSRNHSHLLLDMLTRIAIFRVQSKGKSPLAEAINQSVSSSVKYHSHPGTTGSLFNAT